MFAIDSDVIDGIEFRAQRWLLPTKGTQGRGGRSAASSLAPPPPPEAGQLATMLGLAETLDKERNAMQRQQKGAKASWPNRRHGSKTQHDSNPDPQPVDDSWWSTPISEGVMGGGPATAGQPGESTGGATTVAPQPESGEGNVEHFMSSVKQAFAKEPKKISLFHDVMKGFQAGMCAPPTPRPRAPTPTLELSAPLPPPQDLASTTPSLNH